MAPYLTQYNKVRIKIMWSNPDINIVTPLYMRVKKCAFRTLSTKVKQTTYNVYVNTHYRCVCLYIYIYIYIYVAYIVGSKERTFFQSFIARETPWQAD